ncbi:hypothetical protein GCM10023063_18810 [Arthrobacter methylotrophus]|uniref:Uncharacterized protein n=1 Tax=Arthrobacter methylotrophus TaxID=121291 RepID=A0ABV5UPU9_9MICC
MSKRSEPDKLPTVELEQWLISNKLARHTRSDRACFHRMAGLPSIGSAAESAYGCQGGDCYISGAIFDHPRRFRVTGRNRIADCAGVISAPYLHAHEMLRDAELISDRWGLSFRLDDARDDWYGYGTTSLVLWNPKKISL